MTAAEKRAGWLLLGLIVLTGFVSAQFHEPTNHVTPADYPMSPIYEGK